ncbi:MAG: methenyltetrahydromethanopterin cyclohydrolase [Gammaproteobacteria bacterium]
MNQEFKPSVNKLAATIAADMIANAQALRLGVEKLSNGTTVIDAGVKVPGGLEAGRLVGEICLGGLGTVSFSSGSNFKNWRTNIDVYSSNPVLACLASQYAGWSLSHGEGKEKFMALGSGPARALGSSEPLFEELGYRDQSDTAVMVIEVDKNPPAELADEIAEKCKVKAENLTIILTPTSSLAGGVQVVARSLETSLHKAHELHFPLDKVIDGFASAPVSPPHTDFVKAMGRTNDAILFGGEVHLFIDAENDEAEDLANKLPSSSSKDYGKPFADVFKDSGYDFYKIDPLLFSPAKVTVSSMKTGKSFHAGKLDEKLLDQSFG